MPTDRKATRPEGPAASFSSLADLLEAFRLAIGLEDCDRALEALLDFNAGPLVIHGMPRTTINSYRKNQATKAGHRAILLAWDYVEANVPMSPDPAVTTFRQRCFASLKQGRPTRFPEYRYDDAVSNRSDVRRWAGLWVIFRRETADQRIRPELLVMSSKGTKKIVTQACCLSDQVVFRGSWRTMERALIFDGVGSRSEGKRESIHVSFAVEPGNAQILGGLYVGQNTVGGLPTVMPCLAIRVPQDTTALMDLSKAADRYIRGRLNGLTSYAITNNSSFSDLVESCLERTTISPEAIGGAMRARNIATSEFVTTELQQFLSELQG